MPAMPVKTHCYAVGVLTAVMPAMPVKTHCYAVGVLTAVMPAMPVKTHCYAVAVLTAVMPAMPVNTHCCVVSVLCALMPVTMHHLAGNNCSVPHDSDVVSEGLCGSSPLISWPILGNKAPILGNSSANPWQHKWRFTRHLLVALSGE